MLRTYVCPVCFEDVTFDLWKQDVDNIQCSNCKTWLELDYVGDLLDTEYFLVEKKDNS